MEQTFPQQVYQVVSQVPRGCVITYGQIALMTGRPRASRIVGCILARGAVPGIPYHRVVYRDGRLCCTEAFGGQQIQRELLKREGVLFLPDGRVDLRQCGWFGENFDPACR